MSKKKFCLLLIPVAVALVVAWVIHVIDINDIEERKEDVAKLGDELVVDGVSFTASEVKLYDIEAFMNEYSKLRWTLDYVDDMRGVVDTECDMKFLTVILETKVVDESNITVDAPGSIKCANDIFSEMEYINLTSDLNEGRYNVCPEEGKRMYVYQLFSGNFTEEQWDKIDSGKESYKLVFQELPEEIYMLFDDYELVKADEEDRQYFEEQAELMRKTDYGEAVDVLENNVLDKPRGEYAGLSYEVKSVKKLDNDEVTTVFPDSAYESDILAEQRSFYSEEEVDYICRYFVLEYEVTNVSDRIKVQYVGHLVLAFMEDGKAVDLIGEMDSIHSQKEDGVDKFILNPGESIEVKVGFMTIISPLMGEEYLLESDRIWENIHENFYLVVGNGEAFENITFDNKECLFIKTTDVLDY